MTIKNLLIRNKFLTFVLLAYFLLFVLNFEMGLLALQNSAFYFKEMLIIMPVIMLLTALLEAWVPKETIIKNLGEGSGFKGKLFSFLLGSFSAGPLYAAFPVCISLLKKGASVVNMVILLSTWSVIKVPMLAMEARFLGGNFMILRWILTAISVFIISAITAKFVKRDDIMALHQDEEFTNSGVYIKEEFCIGCGVCAKLCPYTFVMENGKAIVLTSNVNPDEKVMLAEKKCPAKAIVVK